jgi:predicted CoA-substrate-specific enzyme activase
MIRAFREIFELEPEEMIIPEHHASMGAIGSVFHITDNPPENKSSFKGLEYLNDYLKSSATNNEHLERLVLNPPSNAHKDTVYKNTKKGPLEVSLGLDVGSLSTNVVLIDDENNVVARRYLPTASRPLEAIKRGLSEIYDEIGDKVKVTSVGTTGSGRYLTGDFIGADTIQNEITAQATAAIAYDPKVDTIFEIGGQDSKYISIDNGVVVDFEMNKVCAAGTGSFLEEQSEKLDIDIKDFGEIALGADKPSRLGDRCTVFMESDLNAHQQSGVKKENLISGLAYSIVHNYILKVVGKKRVGNRIFFQGGVTNNKSVIAAFEKVTGKPITVPPHFDVTGAIGAAILARKTIGDRKTNFKGFKRSAASYSVDKFTCKHCSNQCEIRRVKIEGEKKPLFYGGRCERYEVEERKGKGKDIPNLFDERLKYLMDDFTEEPPDGKTTIGIPRGLMVFYQQFPYWRTFFEELGFRIVLSDPTNRKLITQSLEKQQAETCFPCGVMHGHVLDLLAKDTDYIFLPSIIDSKAEKINPTKNYNCPWVQSFPYMARAGLRESEDLKKLMIPVFHFRYSGKVLNNEVTTYMSEKFNIPKTKTLKAMKNAKKAQETFERKLENRGREVLDNLPENKKSVVVIGRPYNTNDPELNLHLVEKLINLDVLPIPIDFLPLSKENIYNDYSMMYWPNGRNILAASRIIARNNNLNAVYLGNFRCGPDSFLTHFVREEMKDKPYLQLEVDEHSADAGMITRCEAFLDSLESSAQVEKRKEKIFLPGSMRRHFDRDRVLYFPYMADHAFMLAAASRHCGVNAQVLEPQDERSLELGRKYTSSKECFPFICTTGAFLRKILEPGFEPEKASFFMPDHNGPCRFGQYNRLQRIIFDHLGYQNVEIISPGNDNSYEGLSDGQGTKFRKLAWKGVVIVDILRKFLQEKRPYEKNEGDAEKTYQKYLREFERSIENGAKEMPEILVRARDAFKAIPENGGPRRPVISITGEVYMRDNPSCNGYIADKLEKLGAEILVTPIREWITYSTYRYWRDSSWNRNIKGLIKSKIQWLYQHAIEKRFVDLVKDDIDIFRDIELEKCLELCTPYIDKSYDGQPAILLGSHAGQVKTGISGIVNIMPFTCMPETFTTSVTPIFRKDFNNIPWINIAYDGQEDTSIDTKLQALMYQAKKYAQTMQNS